MFLLLWNMSIIFGTFEAKSSSGPTELETKALLLSCNNKNKYVLLLNIYIGIKCIYIKLPHIYIFGELIRKSLYLTRCKK